MSQQIQNSWNHYEALLVYTMEFFFILKPLGFHPLVFVLKRSHFILIWSILVSRGQTPGQCQESVSFCRPSVYRCSVKSEKWNKSDWLKMSNKYSAPQRFVSWSWPKELWPLSGDNGSESLSLTCNDIIINFMLLCHCNNHWFLVWSCEWG